jgi:uncharacterized protein
MYEVIIDKFLNGLLGLDPVSRLYETLNFFIYDSIKILFLLFFMIAFIGFFRTFVSQQKVRKWLVGKKKGVGNVLASIFGTVTPFCSCSSIPLFLSFLKAGIPLGITFSFLITSPLVNEYLVVLMLGFFGWKITLAYIASGILVGVVSGLILGKMKLEKHLVKEFVISKNNSQEEKSVVGFKNRLYFGLDEAWSIVRKLWAWILFGVGIGAVIHNYVPSELIQSWIGAGGIFTVPLATILGVPLYGGCAAIVPIAVVLFQKGIPLGTVLAFMMAISALSFPEAVILRRAMKLKLIAIFFGVVTVAIILIGYLFNVLQMFLV